MCTISIMSMFNLWFFAARHSVRFLRGYLFILFFSRYSCVCVCKYNYMRVIFSVWLCICSTTPSLRCVLKVNKKHTFAQAKLRLYLRTSKMSWHCLLHVLLLPHQRKIWYTIKQLPVFRLLFHFFSSSSIFPLYCLISITIKYIIISSNSLMFGRIFLAVVKWEWVSHDFQQSLSFFLYLILVQNSVLMKTKTPVENIYLSPQYIYYHISLLKGLTVRCFMGFAFGAFGFGTTRISQWHWNYHSMNSM